MMCRTRVCRAANGLLRAAAAALLASACEPARAPDVEAVRIVLAGVDRASNPAERASGRLWENGAVREIRLDAPLKRVAGRPWQERVLRDAEGGRPFGRLLFGPNAAALHYHLASRDPTFPRGALRANRLVVLEAGDQPRLGLLVEPGAERGVASAAMAELSAEAGPRVVALAQVLGAWGVLADDRHPLDASARPFLPFFVPRAGGDWRDLGDRSLEAFLPPSLARHVAETPGFRSRLYRHLADYSTRLPALAEAAERFAATLQAPSLVAEIATLRALLSDSFEAYQGYLDSAWIELIVRVRQPDSASVRIYVNSVSDVRLDALVVEMPRKRLVVASEMIAGLRLAAAGTGTAAATPVRLGQDRLEFPLGFVVEARPRGPYAFEGARIDLELTGLAPLGAKLWPLLDQLQLRATNRTTAKPVPDEHVQRLVSLEDPRFAVGSDDDVGAFLASLGSVLERDDAVAGESLVSIDRSNGAVVLPAGSYLLKEDLILPAGRALLLEAGVELRVRPGRSLLVRGPLEVRGTQQRPVRVRGTSLSEPWGVLAVQGRGRSTLSGGRSRCVIRHLELAGGSEDYLKGVFYSGQLSVHHADLVLEHATLSRASADDGLNVKHASVRIRDSVFRDNAADAIDLDWVDGGVERSFFARSGKGGDGIDLSGSDVAVEDSVVSDAPDKCLSVGEESTLRLRGSLLRGCDVGVASKDGSLADVRESVLLGNGRNFAAYQKKPIFGGGRIRAADLVLVGASEADERDDLSQIAVERARVAPVEGLDVEALWRAAAFSRERFRALPR
jgi:hypothetical protein